MLDQILEIICSCASVMVGVNIAVRWVNSVWSFSDGATTMLFDATCIGAVVYVLAEMPTPYTISTSIRTRQTSVGYILIAGSRICSDPSIIASSAVDVLSATMNYTARMSFVGVRDTVVIDPDTILQSSGATIIEIIVISKLLLLFSGIYLFMTGVILEGFHKKIRRSSFLLIHVIGLVPAVGIVVLWVVHKGVHTISYSGILTDLIDTFTVNGIGPSAAQVVLGNNLYKLLGYFDSGCFLLSIFLMIVYAFVDPILVLPLSTYAYACFAMTLHFQARDEWYLFSITYCAAFVFFIVSAATFVRHILQTHIYDVLFRVGVGCSVLSIAYLFLSCNLSWWSLRFGTGSIGDEFEKAVQDVYKFLIQVVGGIYDLMQKLNPCSVSHNTNTDDMTDTRLIDAGSMNNEQKISTESMRTNRIEARMNTSDYSCFTGSCYDRSKILECSFDPTKTSSQCKKAAELDETLGNSSIVRGEDTNYKFTGKDGDDDEEDSGDAENFVKKCESLVCEITLGVGLAAFSLSWVPFVGGPGSFALKMASAVGHNVFRFGKRLLGLLPRLRRNRTLIRSLVSMVRQLTKAGSSMTQFETRLLLLSLSIFISFTTVLIFATQRTRNPDAVAKNVSNIIISVLAPVFCMNVLCLAIVVYVPVTFREVLGILPEIISVDLILKEGYYALRMSHVLSTMSIGILTMSELMFLIDYDMARLWNKIRTSLCGSRSRKIHSGSKSSSSRCHYLRNLWARIQNIDNRFTATVLFFIIGAAIFVESFIMKRSYVEVSYGGDSTVTGWVRQFGALDSHMERQSSIHETMDVEFCGMEGQIVFAIAKALMSVVVDAAKLFLEAFTIILKAGATVLSLLVDLSNIGVRKIDLIRIPSLFGLVGKTIAYGVPGIGFVFTFAALLRTAESDRAPFSYLIGIVWLECANIIVQICIGTFLGMIMKIKVPFIMMSVELGHDFYASIFCSLLVIMACVSIYIGQLI